MKHRPRLLLALPLLAALTLLEPRAAGRRAPDGPVTAAPGERIPFPERAAEAVRRRDLEAARELIEPLMREPGPLAAEARVILGLYAHACGDPHTSRELLLAGRGYDGRFADWRLFTLAETASALELPAAAQAALAKLLREHPGSPLRRRALELAIDVAVERGDHFRALELIRQARVRGPEPDAGARLELLAWRLATELGSRPLQEEAARRLLVEHPIEASKEKVIELFRRPDGGLEWPRILGPRQLERRARRLLDHHLEPNALAALAEVEEEERGLDWRLLHAEALIENHRGMEALAVLDDAAIPDEPRAVWLRSTAALDASMARRGRRNLASADRERMAARAHEELRHVAASDAGGLARAALAVLFSELAEDDGELGPVLEVLRDLRRLDPEDTTGAPYLWKRGWREFVGRNPSGAIGFWREQMSLYPASAYSRAALYWSGRAHQRLGDGDRARRIFEQVAAARYSDFYRRHALAHLSRPPAPAEPGPPVPWPSDPALGRARLLTDLGLDGPALVELEGRADSVEPAAWYALRAEVLARLGRRRESIDMLRHAFPALGTPRQDSVPAEALRMYYPLDFGPVIEANARARGLPPNLIRAMIRQESAFDPGATSWAGARGLMQVMPATGRELAGRLGLRYSADRLTEPDFSVRLGTAYFGQVLEMFDHNEVLALAAYNGGPYRIRRLWRQAGSGAEIDRFVEGLNLRETRIYVKRVLLFEDSYRLLYG